MFAKQEASCLRHQHHPTRPIATNVAAVATNVAAVATNVAASLTTPRRSDERRGAHENDAAVGHEAAASVSTLRRLRERRGVVEDVAAGAREASLLGDMQRSNIPAFFMKEVTSHNHASRPDTHHEHDKRHERPFVGLGALCCGHVHSQAPVARRDVRVWRASGCHHVPVRKTSASSLCARSTSWCKPQLGAAVWT